MNIERKNPGQDKEGVVDEAVRAIREVRVPEGPPAEVVARVLAAGNREQSKFAKGRFNKMNRLMKIAAVILIVVGIGVGIMWFAEGSTSVAWADVGATFERARTICFTMTKEKGEGLEYSCRMMYSEPGLTRMESEGFIFIGDWANGRFLTLIPQSKTAHSGIVDELENPYHKNWLDHLREQIVGNKKVVELGTKELAGRTARGWRLQGKRATGTVWADAKTAELIRVEIEEGYGKWTMSDFEFDKELDESLFSLEPPDDYGLHTTATMKASEPRIEDVAGLLRIWAMGCDNRFPKNLHSWEFLKAVEDLDWRTVGGDEATLQDMMSRAFWLLYGESGWKYVGAGVALGDGDTAIFWHRRKGSEKYKVIYGDLSIKEMAKADLPKSE